MQEQDRDPIVAICLLAAMADGDRSSQEQAEFQRIAARLGGDASGYTALGRVISSFCCDAINAGDANGPEENRGRAY